MFFKLTNVIVYTIDDHTIPISPLIYQKVHSLTHKNPYLNYLVNLFLYYSSCNSFPTIHLEVVLQADNALLSQHEKHSLLINIKSIHHMITGSKISSLPPSRVLASNLMSSNHCIR